MGVSYQEAKLTPLVVMTNDLEMISIENQYSKTPEVNKETGQDGILQ